MDRFGLVGVSHRRSSAEELAHFSRPIERPAQLREALGVEELLHFATCNRVELVYAARSGPSADQVLERFARWLHPEDPRLQEYAAGAGYALAGDAAAKHLLHALCGLDSLVLGDAQIVGQFKRALVAARQEGVCGRWLGLLGDEALKVARRIRAAEPLPDRPTSVSEVAALELRRHARGAQELRLVLVGGGEMIRALASRLKGWRGAELLFVNRTLARALDLAEAHGGRARSLAEFRREPGEFDALVAATAAHEPVLGAADLARLPVRARPRLLLDLGMPADLDPALGERPDCVRRDVLELGRLAAAGREEAERYGRRLRPLVRDGLAGLRARLVERSVGPAARELRKRVEERVEVELARWMHGRLRHLPEEDRTAVEELALRLAEQTVQVPLQALRRLARNAPHSAGLLLETWSGGLDGADRE